MPVNVVILVGRKANTGAQTFFCLSDHEWIYGNPAKGRGWCQNHARDVHGGTASFVEVPNGVPYRPPPVDRMVM